MLRQWDVPSGLSESTSDTMIGKQDRKMDRNEKCGFTMFQVACLSTVSWFGRELSESKPFDCLLSLSWCNFSRNRHLDDQRFCMFSASYFDLKRKRLVSCPYTTVDVLSVCLSNINNLIWHLSLSQVSRGLKAILNLRILQAFRDDHNIPHLENQFNPQLRSYWWQHIWYDYPFTTVLFHLLISK